MKYNNDQEFFIFAIALIAIPIVLGIGIGEVLVHYQNKQLAQRLVGQAQSILSEYESTNPPTQIGCRR